MCISHSCICRSEVFFQFLKRNIIEPILALISFWSTSYFNRSFHSRVWFRVVNVRLNILLVFWECNIILSLTETEGNDSNFMVGRTEIAVHNNHCWKKITYFYTKVFDPSMITFFILTPLKDLLTVYAMSSRLQLHQRKKNVGFQKPECSRFHPCDFCNKEVLRDVKSKNLSYSSWTTTTTSLFLPLFSPTIQIHLFDI